MMYSKITVFCLIFFVFACKSSEEKAMEKIKDAEAALYGDGKSFNFSESKAREAIAAYKDFVEQNPQNPQSPEMLLKAADLHRALKEFEAALEIYGQIENQYPDYPKIAHVIFLQGFVYENELGLLPKAKERYEVFLKKFPAHELANDVKFSLKNLGKTPEEIIREFERQQQLQTTEDTSGV